MSEPISLGYTNCPWFFPPWKWVDCTLELTALTAQQRLGPSCWGSFLGEEPVRIIYGGVGSTTALRRGAETSCCLSYSLFRRTHVYCHSIRPGISGTSQGGKWWTFLVHLGGCISDPYVSMHKATSISSACSPGLSQPASAEANTYFSNVSAAIYILPSNLKLRTKLDICIDDVPPSICIDVLGWRPPNYFLFSLLQLQSIEASGFIGDWFQFVVLDKNGPLLMLRKM